MANLYSLVGLAMFIAIGGDAWTLHGLQKTFELVPLTKAHQIASLTSGVEQAFATIFVSAVEVAAPVILALLITDVAFGMIAKVVPQVNIFGVGFPMKVGVAMLIVAASLPFLGSFMSDQIANAVTGVLQFI
jgi:flagellar biosynthetic protein FliR